MKLIERDKTFYMSLGFDFEITNHQFPYVRFDNKETFIKEINRLIKNIRSIKTIDLIKEYENTINLLNTIIKDNYKGEFQILNNNSNPTKKEDIFVSEPKDKINELFVECKDILDILHKYTNIKLFYKILVKLFKTNCTEYGILYKYIVENQRTKIIYNNKIIKRNYVYDFDMLIMYRYNYLYSYVF